MLISNQAHNSQITNPKIANLVKILSDFVMKLSSRNLDGERPGEKKPALPNQNISSIKTILIKVISS